MNLELYEIIIIASVALIIILALLLTLIYRKNKKDKIEPLSKDFLSNLVVALGENNLESVEIENKRIRLMLKDVKAVDAMALKELDVPAFLKGNELKLLIKNHTNEVYKYLNERGHQND